MAFKFYINGQLTDQPDNDTELITTIKRDSDLGGFLTTQDVTLIYSNDNAPPAGTVSGYSLLKAIFDSGTCSEVDIQIFDEISATETYRIYTGVIGAPSIKVEEQGVSLSCKIDDNSFYSFIKNNRNIPFNLYATKTKNGLMMDDCQIYVVDMFDSATGSWLSTLGYYYYGYRIYDVLEFLIRAISDNRVGFASDYLSNLSTPLFIFDGFALGNPNTNPNVVVTLDQILSEVLKLKNLLFYIDQTDPDNPVFRLEEATWFFNAAQILTFDEPLKLTTSVKENKIYGTVRVGSEYNPGGSNPPYTWNAGTSYFGWKKEVYTPLGQCNTDQELDLVNDFIIASNAIDDQINGGATGHDDDLFLIECYNVDTVVFSANAYYYSFPTTGLPYYYNMGLNNVNKLQLHGTNFQAAVTNTQNAGTDVFRASMGADNFLMNQDAGSGLVSLLAPPTPAVLVPVPFADELGNNNYDPGQNYNNTPGFYCYVAPVGGNYSFKVDLHNEVQNLKSGITPLNTVLQVNNINIPTQYAVYFDITIEVYVDDTFGSLITSQTTNLFIGSSGIYNHTATGVFTLTTGNAVRVRTTSQFCVLFPTLFGNTPVPVSVLQGGFLAYTSTEPRARIVALEDSTFECNGTPDGALILAPYDPEAYKVRLHEFEYDLTQTELRDITAMPIGSFPFTKDGVTRIGWIEELQYSQQTGRAKVKLITNDATT